MNRIMVNIAKVDTTELAKETGLPAKEVEKVVRQIITDKNNNKRQPRPPAPKGGITLRGAERKYHISHKTISRWARQGHIPILLRTLNELYVDEKQLTLLISQYKNNPGQGKRTILACCEMV